MFKKGLALLSILTILGANNDYQDWLRTQSNEYNAYKKSLDEEFSEMLKKDWELFKSLMDPGPYEKPKPTVMPKVKKATKIPKKDIDKSPKAKVKKIKQQKIVAPSNKPKIGDIKLTIDENSQAGKVIGKLPIITSGDSGINLVDLFDPQTRSLSNEFEILTNGSIVIRKGAKLDFEKRTLFKLMTIASNSFGDSNRADVVIKLNDLKNEILPQLQAVKLETLENTKAGTVLGKLEILNKKQLDSKVSEFVLTGKGSNNFVIDTNGNIKVAKDSNLDYEATKQFDLKVYGLNKAGNSKSTSLQILLKNVVEKSDKEQIVVKYKVVPKLRSIELEFEENLKANGLIGKVEVENLKELDSKITRYTLSGKGAYNFYVNKKGEVKLSKKAKIDFEKNDTYELKLLATNKAGSGESVDIVIYVNNIPEFKPKLENFKALVNEDANNKDIVGILNFDSGDSQVSMFQLANKQGKAIDAFGISRSGLIFVKDSSKLNYDKKSSYRLKAVAKNGAGVSNISDIVINLKKKVDKRYTPVKVDFYSQTLEFYYDKKSKYRLNKISKDSIRGYWDRISKTKHKYLLDQIEKTAKKLNLNDWAKYQLAFKTGQSIYKDDNTANLFTWFVLVKMGYDTKVGYNKNKVYLLSTMHHRLYQIAFFNLKGKKYYVLTPNGRVGKVGKIYTYSGNYPKANDKLSFEMENDIRLYTNLKRKNLEFKYYGKMYKITTSYSKDLVDFYKTFPQSDYTIYFGTKNSAPLSNSILRQLQMLVKDKSELEAVNILLRFTQTAFKYKTDQKQFSYEKVMFPEETVYYPYSDCEDRSIMFSFLVKSLLGLEVVGVKYPDHLATAVKFSSNVSGDSFKYKGKRYTISDPTYINANAGMAMPQYKKSKFEIISLQ